MSFRWQIPYRGSSHKLVLAFDIGTTHSKVSYCILCPGKVSSISGVTRYPGQEHVGGDKKIPSILYYDRQGVVKAIGAEALLEHTIEQAEDYQWIKVQWWKLHLQPASPLIKDKDIPPLPQGKNAIQILADFMRYLFACARNYIVESHKNGESMWKSMENGIEFILTHPNGWEGLQQQQIRHAAEMAGLASGHANQIHLLTEGKATAHFCVHAFVSDLLPMCHVVETESAQEEADKESKQRGVIVIDAGDRMIDLSVYSMRLSSPREFQEVAPVETLLQGFTFVTRRAYTFLNAKLSGSRYGTPDEIQQMAEIFDNTTKLRFHDPHEAQYIRFGTFRDKDPQYDIRSGQLKLAGQDVAQLFEPSVQAIADAFERQRYTAAGSQVHIKCAFLIGSFAASDYLYRSLRLHPAFLQVNLYRPSQHSTRVVADGAVLSYVDLFTAQASPSRRHPG